MGDSEGAMDIGFIWDEDKYHRVREKHGVDFAEVVDAFEDELAIFTTDPAGAVDRRMVVGQTRGGRILQVIYTEEDAPLARIITAFEASRIWKNEYVD